MTSAFDQRLVQVGLEIEGKIYTFDNLQIRAQGTKFFSAVMNSCRLEISNLTKEQRQFILTQASPTAKPTGLHPIKMTLDVGRQSYGVFRLFEGDVFQGGVTQPPDIGIILNSLTNNFIKSQTVATMQSSVADLKAIAQQIATANGLKLEYNASPKSIENYSFTGSPDQQIYKLNEMGNVIACVDNGVLVVNDADKPRGDIIREINAQTGMVGVPQPTSEGAIVSVMIDNTLHIGNQVRIRSDINPGCNGDYTVKRMDFDIANRDEPFWYTLECQSLSLFTGATQ